MAKVTSSSAPYAKLLTLTSSSLPKARRTELDLLE
jgi:hypothetical protein